MASSPFLFRSLKTSEIEKLNEVVNPVAGLFSAIGVDKETMIEEISPPYIKDRPQIPLDKLAIAEWDTPYHIHRWFLDKAEDSEDDGGYYWITKEEVVNLLTVLNDLNPDNAEQLMPTVDEYDAYYWSTIKLMKDLVSYLLEHFNWDECMLFYAATF